MDQVRLDRLDVQIRCAFNFFNCPQLCATDFCVFTLMVDVE